MQNGKSHGFGVVKSISNGDNPHSYIGNFSKNKYSGFGLKQGNSLFCGSWLSGKPGGQGTKVNRDGCSESGTFFGGHLVSGMVKLPDGEEVIVRAKRGFIKLTISEDVDMKVKIDEGTRFSKLQVKEFVKKKSIDNIKQTDEVKLIRKLTG